MNTKQEIILIDGYWVIGTNKWSSNIFSKSQAELNSKTLTNCRNCSDCVNCRNCIDCSYCSHCSDCIDCVNCSYCRGCSNCIDCSYCSHCSKCVNCIDCRGCIDCRNCGDCIDCIDCVNCRNCIDFKTNPERIVSPILGSRNSQTTYYWNNDNEQVVCGCFNGKLTEFEKRVKQIHKDNEYAIGYLNWIEKIKKYKLI